MVERSKYLGYISQLDVTLTILSYIGIDAAGGKMFGWRNDAIKPGRPDHWTGMNGAASGLPILALSGWRFVDLNGDHKDDCKLL